MPVYFIAQYVVKDPKLYREYQKGAGPTIAASGGKLLAFDVAAETVEGMHTFTWDGVSKTGATLPPGPYQLSIVAKTTDGKAIDSRVASQGVISEVDLTGDEPILMIGPLGIPLSKAMLLSQTQ